MTASFVDFQLPWQPSIYPSLRKFSPLSFPRDPLNSRQRIHSPLPVIKGKQMAIYPQVSVMSPGVPTSWNDPATPVAAPSARDKYRWESEAIGPRWEYESMGPIAITRYLNGSENPCERLAIQMAPKPKPRPKAALPPRSCLPCRDNNLNCPQPKTAHNCQGAGWRNRASSGSPSPRGHGQMSKVKGNSLKAKSSLGLNSMRSPEIWPTPPSVPQELLIYPGRKLAKSKPRSFSEARVTGRSRAKSGAAHRKLGNTPFSSFRTENMSNFSRKPTSRNHSASSPRRRGNLSFISNSSQNSRLQRRGVKAASGGETRASPVTTRVFIPSISSVQSPANTRASVEGSSGRWSESVLFSHSSPVSSHSEAFELYKQLTRKGSRHLEDIVLSDGTSVDSGKRSPPPKLYSAFMAGSSAKASSSVDPVKKDDDLRLRIRRNRWPSEIMSACMSDNLMDELTVRGSSRGEKPLSNSRAERGLSATSLWKSPEAGHSRLSAHTVPHVTYRDGLSRSARGSEPSIQVSSPQAHLRSPHSCSASSASTLLMPKNKPHGMPPKQKKQKFTPYVPFQQSDEVKLFKDQNQPQRGTLSPKMPWDQSGTAPYRALQSPSHFMAKTRSPAVAASRHSKDALASDPVTQMSMMSTISPVQVECDSTSQGAQLRDVAYLTYAMTGQRAKFPGDMLEVVQYQPESSPKAQSEADTADTRLFRKSEDPCPPKQDRRCRGVIQYTYDLNGHRAQRVVTYKHRNPKPRGVPPGRQMSISRSPFELKHFFLSKSSGNRQIRGPPHRKCHKRSGKTSPKDSRKSSLEQRYRSESRYSLGSRCENSFDDQKLRSRCTSMLNLSHMKSPSMANSLDGCPKSAVDLLCSDRPGSKRNGRKQKVQRPGCESPLRSWQTGRPPTNLSNKRRKKERTRGGQRGGRRRKRRKKKRWEGRDREGDSEGINSALALSLHPYRPAPVGSHRSEEAVRSSGGGGLTHTANSRASQRDSIRLHQAMHSLHSHQTPRRLSRCLPKSSGAPAGRGETVRHTSDTQGSRKVRTFGNYRTDRSHSNMAPAKTTIPQQTISQHDKSSPRRQRQNTAAASRHGRNRKRSRQKVTNSVSQRLSQPVKRNTMGDSHGSSQQRPKTSTVGKGNRSRGSTPGYGTRTTSVSGGLSKRSIQPQYHSPSAAVRCRSTTPRQTSYPPFPAKTDEDMNVRNHSSQQTPAQRVDSAAPALVKCGIPKVEGSTSRCQPDKILNQPCIWQVSARVDSNMTEQMRAKLAKRRSLAPWKLSECLTCRSCLPSPYARPVSPTTPRNSEQSLIARTARKVQFA